MIDVDPGLDSKLQAFFAQIEASTPPASIADINIDIAAPERRRVTFNLLAGVAAAAVIAGSIAVFALELRSHDNPTPAATSAPQSASPSARPTASPSALKAMPLLGSAGIPASAHKVISLTRGQGSVTLETFVPQGTLYIQFDCAGPGPFKILSTDHVIGNGVLRCSSAFGVTTITGDSPRIYDDKPLTLQVTADAAMTWEIYIAESRPPLPAFTVHAGERVLVPVTYGTGSMTLPTFSVGPGEWLDVRDACNSGGLADTLEITGDNNYFGSETQSQCSNADGSGGGGSGSGPPGAGGSGPISVRVKADASISWEIVITEGPGDLELTTPSVQIAPVAFGMGTATLPAFTATEPWSIAVVCSGVGTLTIGPSFSHTATPDCLEGTATFTPPDEVPGQPVSLSVEAPPGMGWEVYIYRIGAPTSPVVCPSLGPPTPRSCLAPTGPPNGTG
jgi:hypothetical protein